jgi:putative DNA primase/helicase
MNGLLDVRTRELKPHTPKFLSTIRIPVTYDPNAACPRITQFFSEVLQPQDVPVIEELFGYCLIPDYSIQRAFLFVGDGANGKSTLLNLLKTFIGQDNVSNVPWHALELDRFAKSALEGKLVNMFADIPSQGLSFTGSFKMLTGGDSIGTEKKFRDYFSFINFARLVFSSNKPPKIYQEDSYAFWRRWVILSFPHQFTGENEDKRLLAKLTTGEELSGLLNIALDGLDRLLKNQGYSYAKSVEETTEIYLRVSDPVYAFVQDCCELDSEASIAKEALYDVFKGYCKLKSTPLIKANAFARQLQNQTHFKVRSGRETVDKKQVTIWQGLKFSEVSEDSEVISSITAYKQNSTVNKIYRENPANPANPTKNLSDNIPGYPTVPCPVCGSIDYWLTDDNRWLCERCHPNPNKEVS